MHILRTTAWWKERNIRRRSLSQATATPGSLPCTLARWLRAFRLPTDRTTQFCSSTTANPDIPVAAPSKKPSRSSPTSLASFSGNLAWLPLRGRRQMLPGFRTSDLHSDGESQRRDHATSSELQTCYVAMPGARPANPTAVLSSCVRARSSESLRTKLIPRGQLRRSGIFVAL
jgi:hypothetical protein